MLALQAKRTNEDVMSLQDIFGWPFYVLSVYPTAAIYFTRNLLTSAKCEIGQLSHGLQLCWEFWRGLMKTFGTVATSLLDLMRVADMRCSMLLKQERTRQ